MAGTLTVHIDVIQGFGVPFNGEGGLFATAVGQITSPAVSMTGAGALSATLTPQISTAPSLAGAGALSLALHQNYIVNGNSTGDGALSATILAKIPLAPNLAGTGALTASTSQIQSVAPAFGSEGSLTATAVSAFTPFDVTPNTDIAGDLVPVGCNGCYLTMIGAGGAGATGGHSTSGASTGGVGGGGGARTGRFFVPVADLPGSTYSITQGQGSGGDSIFSCGSVQIIAGGGDVLSVAGTVTWTGISPITPWANGSGAGAGAQGGHGGNRTQAGTNGSGFAGSLPVAGDPTGLNGAGGRGGNAASTGNAGQVGVAAGGGGGGGGAGNSAGGHGGAGADGYTHIEWV